MCDKLRQLNNKQFDEMDWGVLGEDTISKCSETITALFLCTVRFLSVHRCISILLFYVLLLLVVFKLFSHTHHKIRKVEITIPCIL